MAEALVGGAFLSATLQVLFDRLASPEVVNFFRGPKRNHGDKLLQKLKLSLRGMKPVLEDAERKQITDQSVQEWLDELKHVVYQADDLVDEIATEALRLKVESQYKSGLNQVRAPISTSPSLLDAELVSKIEEIVDSLEYFAKQKDVLGLKKVASQRYSHRLPSTSLVVESDVYGRDDNKEEIIKLLVSEEQNGSEIDVIPIVGMGGVGKTTLAQLVYNDGRVIEHFEMKAWVCVSDEFDVTKVTKIILEEVTSSNFDTQNLNQLQVRLKESLRDKKFLIVLDDVWNVSPGHWDNLRAPFMVGACGSKIIATTRNHGVASIMQTVPVRHLQQVSDEDCWSLFAKIVFYNEDFRDHPELEKIGREIVIQRCKGLPLAVKTLAGLLRSTRDVEEWDNILKSDLWDLPEDKNDILPVLRLSYYYLPSRLKQCFAFCSLFPKDYQFQKKKLVLLWIAQDFVHPPKGNKTLEKVGDEYFHELLSRSFFQQTSGGKSSFVMHDLVHDLAQVVSGQFTVRLDQEKLHDISIKVRHVSYVRDKYYGLGIFRAIENAKQLRTFLPRNPPMFRHLISNRGLDDILSTLQCSRVLSLSGYNIVELPTSIGNLIHLRYLDLSETFIEQLPEIICTLYNLQILLLSNCPSLTTLPEDICKLVCLLYLAISGTNLTKMPMQMGRLRGLQHLTNFVVGKCSGSGINELKEFHHLRGKLSLSNLQNVIGGKDAFEANLKEKKHLEELVLKWGHTTEDSHNEREVLEKLQPHTNLNCLTIENYGGTRFPDWLGDKSYSKIVSLFLNKCNYCFSLPPLGQLPSLKCLTIARMNGITRVSQEFYGDGSSTKPFQSLETLHFEEMSEWVDWQIFGNGEFSQLHELWITKCPKLVGSLPKNIPSWVRLEIRECSVLMASLPRSCAARKLVLAGCDGVGLGWQGVSSLVKLHISDLQCLSELPPELCALTNLEELTIASCPNLLSFSFDGIPPTLKKLSINHCEKLVVPLSAEMERCYTSLENLELIRCDTLTRLPLYFFPKLGTLFISYCKNFETLSIVDGHGRMVSFPKVGLPAPNLRRFVLFRCLKFKVLPEQMQTLLPSLESLKLLDCPEIESFPIGGLPSNLRELQISNCKKLVNRRREWGLQRLPSLRDFKLGGDEGVGDSFPEEGLLPSTLTQLWIEDLSNIKSLNKRGFKLLCSLKWLCIFGCPQLRSLPEEWFPASLESLWIFCCPQLQALPEEGLPASLETLRISDCPQLQALPQKGLPPSLSVLEIKSCLLLKPRCQRDRGDDWHKIAHITCVIIDFEMIS
ncbi:putative disease resistance RPP13-like protein 1 [Actinidia eriantha]|uniref:putative disease resistance RPP13-like protein 1 n=1 Tax=Actinidia eriantha TaxID=165200 RepID=UPI0025903105|nr:putative disease resistance RPP13-like protein 1 [Actinidia eriantha]XP_057499463.1 putative disease resistance RPP13-like protein 1 [Actinidia eriantha]XP_057499464.1 putative disease resistance RPP13-like protein 1 [Actinidia eriantha]